MKVEKKLSYDKKLCNLLDEYRHVIINNADIIKLDSLRNSSFQMLIKKGDKVTSSEVALLAKLGIRSFSCGLVVLSVYDNGSVFIPNVLNSIEDDLIDKFTAVVSMVASSSLVLSYLTLAVVLGCSSILTRIFLPVLLTLNAPSYKLKEYLKDPSKLTSKVPSSIV
ncbi:60S acidic ribosomal protein P0-like [Asparagus officinalis]|uniref:60S acidic ribosomal protein P0-like n=1 Tax=Asparagus officinalis TaxID=4686 RepID=UPI00098E71C3|nr:60S acidic ribosomal protein P0-like [Asparagus officinalis]